MRGKTHKSAVVVIPPRAVWPAIQAIRRRHDRKIRRWMPHVTLLYPFWPKSDFDEAARLIARACARLEPFEARLATFRYFRHGKSSYTLWLAPEPVATWVELHTSLENMVPGGHDVSRRSLDFTPHLSVGQFRRREGIEVFLEELQRNWKPLAFEVSEVCLIWRGDPPRDVFRVARRVPLGRKNA